MLADQGRIALEDVHGPAAHGDGAHELWLGVLAQAMTERAGGRPMPDRPRYSAVVASWPGKAARTRFAPWPLPRSPRHPNRPSWRPRCGRGGGRGGCSCSK